MGATKKTAHTSAFNIRDVCILIKSDFPGSRSEIELVGNQVRVIIQVEMRKTREEFVVVWVHNNGKLQSVNRLGARSVQRCKRFRSPAGSGRLVGMRALAAGFLSILLPVSAQTDWPAFRPGPAGMSYSPLKQGP